MESAASAPASNPILGMAIATLAAVLFAVGAVLQHASAEKSTVGGSLRMGQLLRRPRWVLGQLATASGTGMQVVALGLAPVAVVQPVCVARINDPCAWPRLNDTSA